jgi:hypothetical protein
LSNSTKAKIPTRRNTALLPYSDIMSLWRGEGGKKGGGGGEGGEGRGKGRRGGRRGGGGRRKEGREEGNEGASSYLGSAEC